VPSSWCGEKTRRRTEDADRRERLAAFQVRRLRYFSSSIYPGSRPALVSTFAEESGEEWHRRDAHEKQTSRDFFRGRELVERRVTKARELALWGGSQRRAARRRGDTQRRTSFAWRVRRASPRHARYTFGSGKTWVEEYGSADDAEDFKTLYAYSPYSASRRGEYPRP